MIMERRLAFGLDEPHLVLAARAHKPAAAFDNLMIFRRIATGRRVFLVE